MNTKILASVFILATAINASAEKSFLQIGNNFSGDLNNIETAANDSIDSPTSTQPLLVPDNRPTIQVYKSQSTDAAGNVTTNTIITETPAVISDTPTLVTVTPVTTTVTNKGYTRLIDAGGTYDASGDTYSPKIDFEK